MALSKQTVKIIKFLLGYVDIFEIIAPNIKINLFIM